MDSYWRLACQTFMKISVVLNPGSGTLRTFDLNDIRSTLTQALSEAGHELISWHDNDQSIADSLHAALEENPDCLMIAGGDGSVAAAAQTAWKNDKILAILPGGTMNLYARTLQLPMDLAECALAYRHCKVANMDIGTADGQVFLHQFTVGLHSRMVRLRNRMSYGSKISKVWASLRALIVIVFHPSHLLVDLVVDQKRLGRRTVSAVSVTNNLFGPGHIPYADNPDGGVLGIYYSDPMRPGVALRLVLDTFMGTADNNARLHSDSGKQVRLTFSGKRKHSRGMLDGELVPLGDSLEFRIHPGCLRVLLPVAKRDSDNQYPSEI